MNRAPTASDDITTGCIVGMDWVHEIAPDNCECYKALSVSQGAAIWRKQVMVDGSGLVPTEQLPPGGGGVSGISDVPGLVVALAAKLPITDPSVTNARTPTAHTHAPSEITGTAVVSATFNSLLARYQTILQANGSHIAARVAGTYGIPTGGALAITGTGTLYPIAIIRIDSTDFPTISGVAPKLRVKVLLETNDVAPTGNYTIGLHPITRPATSGGAGLIINTIGAAVAGSTVVFTTPSADSALVQTGAAFALPADGFYCLGVVTTATVAASSLVQIQAQLQANNS